MLGINLKISAAIFALFLFVSPVFSQTHVSVSLENHVYYILEQSESRGLCSPLSGIRPYSVNVIYKAIDEILAVKNIDKISADERDILTRYQQQFEQPKNGLDPTRGTFGLKSVIGKNNAPLTLNAYTGVDTEVSSGFHSALGKNYFGMELWINAILSGDITSYVSWEFGAEGGLTRAPRELTGQYNTYYEGFFISPDSEFQNRLIDVFSQPLTHFPYTYKKRWDGSVYFFKDLTMYSSWPSTAAGAYNLRSEMTASFLSDKLILRLGRISHDWGSTTLGSSLAFNKMARPFLGIEAEFFPVPWFGMASLTGFLEYFNSIGIYESPKTSQNAFSVTMFQFRYKNYLFFDFIDAAVWPKRFELGYISPITNSFFYQNNIGKFDNMAMAANLKARYPGLADIWLSLFVDEMSFTSNFFELDREMLAIQAGASVSLPFFSFSSLKLSYTKVNPYTYTHHRNILPWYGDLLMEKSYTNNGEALGYYLPPNSDEILIQLKTMPLKSVTAIFQYQLIRHGADFGSSAVDGSSLLSELDPNGREGSNPILRRFFLQDGAYQWSHILKAGVDWKEKELPFSLYLEAGFNFSYFTNTEKSANIGEASKYAIIDTAEYPKSTAIIIKMGIRIYPR